MIFKLFGFFRNSCLDIRAYSTDVDDELLYCYTLCLVRHEIRNDYRPRGPRPA
jgi:hypothetical protein